MISILTHKSRKYLFIGCEWSKSCCHGDRTSHSAVSFQIKERFIVTSVFSRTLNPERFQIYQYDKCNGEDNCTLWPGWMADYGGLTDHVHLKSLLKAVCAHADNVRSSPARNISWSHPHQLPHKNGKMAKIMFNNKENAVIIYSPSCHSKHVWLTFFCKTQKIFWKMLVTK